MTLFKIYLKQNLKWISLFLIFTAVFAAVFFLYNITLRAVIYPFFLCVTIGISALIIDFRSVKKKHEQLCYIQQLTSFMIDKLPEPKTVSEFDYQKLVKNLTTEISELEYNNGIKYREMIDYYTVWAHQIKTPIASMKLSLQNEDTPLARKLDSDLFRISQYVDMVLAFLRLNSTSNDYVFKDYNIDSLLKSSIKNFSSEFIARKIRLIYEPIEKTVVTDEKWLSFVIEQLLSNSLKYTRSGYIRIYLSDENTLCIEDSGIGIAPDDLPRIFEKGYTGYNGRIDKSASGLGLYLCKQICQNLGMAISAESEIDRGTKIYLSLDQYKIKAE